MPWPTPQDYNEAIQNPRTGFSDPELQSGAPELTALGLPRPISGAFASVYRMRCANREWAVRCFLRELPDQQRRYEAIGARLASARLPFTVGFAYLPLGLRIRGSWYPVLKMEWATGVPLDRYIESNLRDPAALRLLADRWLEMAAALRRAGIAHGDLQHGNVVVSNGALRLLDYDGMYVPQLAGQLSHELGHRNYQHPDRDESEFGPHLDEFSHWVIHLTLIALSVQPDLWRELQGGDERLLFRREDFLKPDTSPIFTRLLDHPNTEIQARTRQFRSLLTMPPGELPIVSRRAPGARLRPVPEAKPRRALGAGLQAAPEAKIRQATTAGAAPRASVRPAWLEDYLPAPAPPLAFALERRTSQITLAAFLAAVLLVSVCVAPAAASHTVALLESFATTCLLFATILFACFFTHPFSRERRLHAAQHGAYRRSAESTERAQLEIEREIESREAAYTARRDALEALRHDYQAREREELSQLLLGGAAGRDSLRIRRDATLGYEREELTATRRRIQPEIDEATDLLNQLDLARQKSLDEALERLRQTHRADYLETKSIFRADITGIGPAIKLRLRIAGCSSAQDLPLGTLALPWLNARQARALEGWRAAMEALAARDLPNALSAEETARTLSKTDARRQRLTARRVRAVELLSAEGSTVRERYAVSLAELDREIRRAEKALADRTEQVADGFAALYDEIDHARATLDAEYQETIELLETRAEAAAAPLPALELHTADSVRELERYARITFREYVRSLMRFR